MQRSIKNSLLSKLRSKHSTLTMVDYIPNGQQKMPVKRYTRYNTSFQTCKQNTSSAVLGHTEHKGKLSDLNWWVFCCNAPRGLRQTQKWHHKANNKHTADPCAFVEFYLISTVIKFTFTRQLTT